MFQIFCKNKTYDKEIMKNNSFLKGLERFLE